MLRIFSPLATPYRHSCSPILVAYNYPNRTIQKNVIMLHCEPGLSGLRVNCIYIIAAWTCGAVECMITGPVANLYSSSKNRCSVTICRRERKKMERSPMRPFEPTDFLAHVCVCGDLGQTHSYVRKPKWQKKREESKSDLTGYDIIS